ncbi:MAG: hypothetical protein JJE10_08190 [Thermoleophilia bacterium]|nr:hypothetical protein [Thermoleophilia bacterium]
MRTRAIDESEIGITWVMDDPMQRASHALVSDGKVWIIDPVDDHEVMEKVAALGEPQAVLQLLDRHNRHSKKIASRLDIPHVFLPEELRGTPFEAVDVVNNRIWKERALWWKDTKTLVVPEAVGTADHFFPSEAGAGVHIGLRLNPPKKTVGTFMPQHLLVGHGEAIHGPGATKALQEAIDRSVRDLPRAIAGIPGQVTKRWRG